MAQLSVPKDQLAGKIAQMQEDGCTILKSHISADKKEVVLIYREPVQAQQDASQSVKPPTSQTVIAPPPGTQEVTAKEIIAPSTSIKK